MDFLSNLFSRLFGKKQKEQEAPSAPAPVAAPSKPLTLQQPSLSQAPVQQPDAPQLPEIRAASLTKAQPIQPPSQPYKEPTNLNTDLPGFNGVLQKVGDYFNPSVGGLDNNNAFYNAIDKLAGGNSIIGENGYFNKQIIQPVVQGGVQTVEDPSLLGKGMGVLNVARGAFNATPIGLAANAAIPSAASLVKASKGQNVNPLEEINNNTQLSQAFEVKNPVAATALDLVTNAVATNPVGIAAGVSTLGELKNASGFAGVAKTLLTSAKNILGLNPETTGFAGQQLNFKDLKARALQIAPGVTSVNPSKVAQVDQAAEVVSKESEIIAAAKRAEISGPRTVNDLTGTQLTPEQVQAMDLSVPEAPAPITPQVDVRGISGDIRPLAKAPVEVPQVEAPVVPPVQNMAEIQQAGAARPDAALQTAFEQAFNSGDIEGARAALQQMSPDMQQGLASLLPDQPAVPPVAVQPEIPVVAQPAPVSVQSPVIQPEVPLPQGEMLPAAPNLRQAALKSLGGDVQIPKGNPQREALIIDQTMSRAQGIVNSMDPADVIRMYAAGTPEEIASMINTPQEFALANESLRKLYELSKAGDQAATAAADNALSAMQQFSSKNAVGLRITQQAFDDMPVPMKVNKVISFIKKANVEKFGGDSQQAMALDDPAIRSALTKQMDGLFTVDQAIRDNLASANNSLEAIKANPSAFTRADIKTAGDAYTAAVNQLSDNTRQFARLYDQWVPGSGGVIQKIGDYQRTAMLSSLSSRVQDVLQTGLNAGREINNTITEGNIGKVLNVASGQPGKFLDTGISPIDMVKAIPGALKKSANEVAGLKDYGSIGDVVSGLKSMPDRTDISGAKAGPVTRLVKAGTNFATNLTEGAKDGQTLRLLRQDGIKQGFKGEDLRNFVEAAKFNPPEQVVASSRVLQETINNLNDNPISSTMRAIGNAAEKNLGKPGAFIKNAVMPFPTWLGGNIWNSITDRNVIANVIKATVNAKRDPQYAVQQLAKAINGTAEAYALGWVMTANGLITNQDANGDSYEGLYLHFGDRYIPVSSIGAFAPNIILGNAAFSGFKDQEGNPDGEGFAKNIADSALKTIQTAFPALSVSSATGGDSYLNRGFGQIANDPEKGLATIGAGLAGQFIPSLGGDINAVLNNYTDLNPTREAADTTVVNPDSASGTASDPIPTALNQLKNRVPFLSQALPRELGKAAPDLLDRVTKGNRDTATTVEARDKAMTLDQQKKDFAARDVPHYAAKYKDGASFEGAVQAKVENGDYKTAIEALQAKLDKDSKNKDIPKSKIKDQQDEITKLKVAMDGKFDPSIIKTYKDTNLTEWRAMNDPESDQYNPELYQKLWEYDTALANAKVSRNNTSPEKNFYSQAKAKKGTGVPKSISGNTVGDPVNLGKVDIAGLSGRSTGVAQAPTISKIKSADLVKKRTISVSKGR